MAEIGLAVDWTTTLLQVVNFLILLAVLQRFLYRPLRRTMEAREAEIDSEIEAAKRRAEEAEREREALASKLAAAEDEAEQIRAAARAEAAERREAILAQARAEAADLRAEASERVRREEAAAAVRIGERARRTAVELAADLLREVGGDDLHDRVVDRLLRGADELGDADLERLADAIRTADGAVRIRTAYPLAPDTLQRLRERLRDRLSRDDAGPIPDLEFAVEEAPELVAGLTLISGNVALELNVRSALEETVEGGDRPDDDRGGDAADVPSAPWARPQRSPGDEAG